MELAEVELDDGGKGIVIVDDIFDSGHTLAAKRNEFRSATFGAWIMRGKHDGVIFSAKCDHDAWFVFPWENEAQAKQDRADYEVRMGART